jgi:hypothetical protein
MTQAVTTFSFSIKEKAYSRKRESSYLEPKYPKIIPQVLNPSSTEYYLAASDA